MMKKKLREIWVLLETDTVFSKNVLKQNEVGRISHESYEMRCKQLSDMQIEAYDVDLLC